MSCVGAFVVVRDARGALVHIRRKDDGECVGCIEAGLYEIVRLLVLEAAASAAGEGSTTAAAGRRS
jgi:hypothetical protein